MSEQTQVNDWWLAADGRWYPPHARGVPGIPPTMEEYQAAQAAAVEPTAGITERNWQRATPTPDRPGGVATQWAATAVMNPYPVAPTPSTAAVPGFDDNPFQVAGRSQMPAPMRKRGRVVLPIKIVLLLALAAGASAAGFYITHPSPTRSPDATAVDFYQQLEHHQYQSALKVVAPSERSAAAGMASMSEVQAFISSLQTFSDIEVVNPTAPATGATTQTVSLQGCGSDFSCSGLQTVPTMKVKGHWYVDFATWDQSLPGQPPPFP